jgi:hypothetical protein
LFINVLSFLFYELTKILKDSHKSDNPDAIRHQAGMTPAKNESRIVASLTQNFISIIRFMSFEL